MKSYKEWLESIKKERQARLLSQRESSGLTSTLRRIAWCVSAGIVVASVGVNVARIQEFLELRSSESVGGVKRIHAGLAEVIVMKQKSKMERLQARQDDYEKMLKESRSDIFKKHGSEGFKKPGSMKK